MTDRELMQQAIAALIEADRMPMTHQCQIMVEATITALRERLAQPEPPVLTGIDCSCGKKWRILNNTLTASEPETVMAAYKHQTYAAYKTGGEMKIGVVPEQEPVCAHDIPKTKCSFCRVEYKQPDHDWEAEYTKQVELHNQTLDELRDALAQPEQEPVAWLVQYSNKHEFVWGQKPQWIADAIGIEPLYTARQRREWVGLTDDQVSAIADQHPVEGFDPSIMAFARAIEAKLKEKNNG